ncbi:MAG: AAA family ATPase, partial [Myxococcota bacterium]
MALPIDAGSPSRFQLDTRRGELRSGGEARPLPPKALAVLMLLVERAGEVVTRAELVDGVWGGLAISADAVRYTLRQVRIALDDPVDETGFIETVARRGWRFVGRVTRLDDDRVELSPQGAAGAASPAPAPRRTFVGRVEDLEALDRALRASIAGRSQVVFTVGESGIGKTTLIETFVERAAEAHGALVARGECIEYHGAGQPYMPMLEVVERAALGLGREVPAAILRRHAPTWLAQLPSLSDPADRQAIAEEVAGASQTRTIRELLRAFERFADHRPLILWLEDLHWADQSTLDAVAFLAEKLGDAPILLLITMREGEGMARTFAPTLRELERRERCRLTRPRRLDRSDFAAYLAARFGEGAAAARSEALIDALDRSGAGNPLFLVSLVDDLVSRGVLVQDGATWTIDAPIEVAKVPPRLEVVLGRQVEALSEEARTLLEAASVVGLDFDSIELASVLGREIVEVDAVCDRLSHERRFLQVRGPIAWPDGRLGTGFRFRHTMHRAVFLDRVSAGTASRTHRAIAEAREQAFAERLDDVAAQLAFHFEHGLALDRAVEYRFRAGEAAAHKSSNLEATEHLRHALGLVPRLPEDLRWALETRLRLALCAPLAAVAGYGAAELGENLARLEVLTADLEDSPAMFPVLLGLWSLNLIRGDLAMSSALGDRLLRLGEGDPDPLVRLQAHRAVGHCLFYSGRLADGAAHLERAVDGYDVAAHQRLDYSIGDDPVVLVHAYRSWSHWFQGYPERAVADAGEALRQGDRLQHSPSFAFALSYGAVLHQLRRDESRAWQWSDQLLEFARDEGMALWIALGEIIHGWTIATGGELEAGITMLERGLDGWAATGSQLGRPYFVSTLAELLGRVGRRREALALMPQVHELIVRTQQTVFFPERHRVEGVLRLGLAENAEERAAAL